MGGFGKKIRSLATFHSVSKHSAKIGMLELDPMIYAEHSHR